jgi:hypothetical protein
LFELLQDLLGLLDLGSGPLSLGLVHRLQDAVQAILSGSGDFALVAGEMIQGVAEGRAGDLKTGADVFIDSVDLFNFCFSSLYVCEEVSNPALKTQSVVFIGFEPRAPFDEFRLEFGLMFGNVQ